ncbi:MAG TPA: hypothetical protein VLG67_03095 [Candidatus Saccharimonadales bacterium]|nr:hypothetical protein [Candidatus Saccharimonadales bacterium]
MKKENLFIAFIIIVLIFIHGLSDNFFRIDSTTVLLLVIIIFIPYIPLIKKIKYGNFEAEITTDEIRKIEKKVEQIPEKKQKKLSSEKPDILKDLVDSDPALALAKARIEIEKRIRSLAQIYAKDKLRGKFNLTEIVISLFEKEVIEETLENLLVDIITVANRAIHGEFVSKDDAIRLVDIANRAIEELEYVVINNALKTGKVKTITKRAADKFINGKYTVKTIVPYSRNPEIRTYYLNQPELDVFLEGYYETAEYIVSVEKKK